jgi:hypothetical protein
MKTKQTIIIAVAGAALFAVSQAMAQDSSPISASPGDLLLNFRNVGDLGAPDVEVDLGNVSTFLSTASSIGQTIVLDTGASSPTAGYTPLFSISELISGSGLAGVPSADNQIGFSATAVVGSDNTTVYQTRADCRAPSQPSTHGADLAYTAIYNIGLGASGGKLGYLTPVVALGGTDPIVAVPSGNQWSYQVNGEGSANLQQYMSFLGSQNISGVNGPVENINSGSTIYSAFWEVPVSGNGTDTYLGFFTFQPTGEIDFTPANAISTPPNLSIASALSGTAVVVSWLNVGLFTLQQNSNAATAGWAATGNLISTGPSQNSITVTPPTGSMFYRLSNP